MFGFVKFVEGPFAGKKVKIHVENIRHNFKNCDDFDKKKKYYVKYGKQETYHKAQIIFLKDSLEELEETINSSKQRLVPVRSCVTTDDAGSEKEFTKTTRSKSVLTEKDLNKFNCANSKITSSVQIKLEKFQTKLEKQKSIKNFSEKCVRNLTINNSPTFIPSSMQLESSTCINLQNQNNQLDTTVGNIANTIITAFESQSENKLLENTENEKEESSNKSAVKNINCNNQKESFTETQIEFERLDTSCTSNNENSDQNEIKSQISNETYDHKKKSNTYQEILHDITYHSKNECKKENRKLEETIEELKKKYKKCSEEKVKIKRKYEELKSEMERLKAENINLERKKVEYEELNIQLQKKYIEKQSEQEEVEPSLGMNLQNEIQCNTFNITYIPKRSYRKFLKVQYIVISIVIIITVIITAIMTSNRSNSHSEFKKPQNSEEYRLIIRTNDSILDYNYKTHKVHFSKKLQHFGAFEMLGNEVFWSTIDFPKIFSKKNVTIFDNLIDNLDVIFEVKKVNPTALSLDFINDKLYVIDNTGGTLIIIDLKSKKYGLCLADLLNPQELFLDPLQGYMFILQFSKNILRGNMDGSDLEIVQNGLITTMALDFKTKRIYWVKNSFYIESSDYFGKEITSCLKDHVPIISVTIIDRHLFWLWPADNHSNSTLWTCEIQSAGRCENHRMEEIDLHNATYLKSYSGKAKNLTYNPCSLRNGGCQHLCLLTSKVNSGRTCACYLGWQTGSDPRTCERIRDGVLFIAGDFIKIRILSVNDRTSFADAILPIYFEAGITTHKKIIDFEYDSIREEFYWSDDSRIFKKSLKQAEETVTVQVSEPNYVMQDLAMDWVSGNMYYLKCSQLSENDHKLMVFSIAKPIYQSTLFSFDFDTLYNMDGCPHSTVVDPIQGSLYFIVDERGGMYLYKSTISGSRWNRIVEISSYVYVHRWLAMDNKQNIIYQIAEQGYLNVIKFQEYHYYLNRFSVDLTDAKTINIYQDWLYLSTPYSIWRANKTTFKNLTRIWPRPFFEPYWNVAGVRVVDSNVEADYKRSFCFTNNGGCPQLCFSAPKKTCNCTDGQTVQNDGSCF